MACASLGTGKSSRRATPSARAPSSSDTTSRVFCAKIHPRSRHKIVHFRRIGTRLRMPIASDKDIAEFFRLCLRLRLVDVAAVERWADSIVDREQSPGHPVIELALATHHRDFEVDDLLSEFQGHAAPFLSGRI